jgi:hypothetical protein
MEDEKLGRGVIAALGMIDVFESVGVRFFDITHTNLQGEKRGFRPKQSIEETRRSIPFLVPSSSRRQNNLILRPHNAPPVVLIQLDDLDQVALDLARPVAFMCLATSPGNHQAWVAVKDAPNADFARRLRKGAGADPSASGATRAAGTLNYKPKYAPEFPTVQITHATNGLIVTPERLEALGLASPPEKQHKPLTAPHLPITRRARGAWPSYQMCLDRAPKARDADRPDTSRADFTWCMTALDWGWPPEDVASRLMIESTKAMEEGPRYAADTVRNAAAAVERRRAAGPRP